MQIYFAGAEVGSHLNLLRSCGVERVAVSVSNLARNTSTLAGWATRKRLDGLEWVLYADSPHVPVNPALEVLSTSEVTPECVTGPVEWVETTWMRDSDLMFLPSWDAADPTKLREYTENYDGVFLPDAVVDNPTAVRTAKAALNRLGVLGALTGRSKGLERFDILVSSAWWAVQKYGETQVWASNRLVRLNSEDKHLKRQRYAPAMEALGCDVGKILADDPDEILRCAVLSWKELEAYVDRGHSLTPDLVTSPSSTHPSNVVPIGPGVARATPVTRHKLLPVMGVAEMQTVVTDEDGNEVTQAHPTIQVTAESMRQCDSCQIALGCPGYAPHSTCTYQIPVTLHTRGQLVAVLRAITEIQTQRILMGHFAEEINGSHDDQVGKEMDRLFGMVEKWRNIEDNRDTVKMTLEAKGDAGNLGVLSRLFGAQVGHNATLLEEPLTSDEIIDQMEDDEGD